jgi:hypothetical protein
MAERTCEVVFAGIGRSDEDLLPIVNCDDGAYDLHDVKGSPGEIGQAIADSLRESDMMAGSRGGFLVEDGADLYLTVKIRFRRKAEG